MSIKINNKVVAGRGDQGSPGLSAYDLAVKNGYLGTEEEWLSSIKPGFGTPEATIDSTFGAPAVTITASGPDNAKIFSFSFSGLRGEDGAGIAKGGSVGQILAKRTAADYATQWIDLPASGVSSFNGREGDIEPQTGDYTAAMVGAITAQEVDTKISNAINGLINGAPAAYDTLKEISDYIAEDKSAAEAMNLAIGDKVSKSTTINGKALSNNITLSASDVGAATQSDIDAAIAASITAALNASY